MNVVNSLTKTHFSLERVQVFSCAFLCFASLNPYYLWGIGRGIQLVMISVFLMAVFFKKHQSSSQLILGLFVAVLVFLYGILYGMSVFGALYISLFTLLISLVRRDVLLDSYSLFKGFFVFSMVPALLLWFFHNVFFDKYFMFMGYVDDALVPNQLKIEAGQKYVLYPFSVVLNYMLDWPYYRIFGPFDEPGRVGTIAAFLLVIEKFNLKRFSNIIIFGSGLLSFSLAFYILLLIFFVFHFAKKPLIALSMLTCSILVGAVLSQNVFLKSKIVDRFAVASDGKLAGDNRAGASLEESFAVWQNAPPVDYLIGLKNLPAEEGSSWKLIPIRAGLLGVIVFSLFFVSIYFISNGLRLPYSFAFLAVFIASIYQRPDVMSPALIMIFSIGSIVYSKRFNFLRV